jgi:hypothetical protein
MALITLMAKIPLGPKLVLSHMLLLARKILPCMAGTDLRQQMGKRFE